eukprot:4438823-Pleurochrysis_carterae.AAC.1
MYAPAGAISLSTAAALTLSSCSCACTRARACTRLLARPFRRERTGSTRAFKIACGPSRIIAWFPAMSVLAFPTRSGWNTLLLGVLAFTKRVSFSLTVWLTPPRTASPRSDEG